MADHRITEAEQDVLAVLADGGDWVKGPRGLKNRSSNMDGDPLADISEHGVGVVITHLYRLGLASRKTSNGSVQYKITATGKAALTGVPCEGAADRLARTRADAATTLIQRARDRTWQDTHEHTHREAGQVLRHTHSGSDVAHGYFEHHEDGCHITCDHQTAADECAICVPGQCPGEDCPGNREPAERVTTGYVVPGTTPPLSVAVTDRGSVLIGERLGEPLGVNWVTRIAGPAGLAALQQVVEQASADQARIARTLHPSQLREDLRAALRELGGMGTLVQVQSRLQRIARHDLIAELARMRDDGEVEFTGPRYRLLEKGQRPAGIT